MIVERSADTSPVRGHDSGASGTDSTDSKSLETIN
jgi:hypothetical protein